MPPLRLRNPAPREAPTRQTYAVDSGWLGYTPDIPESLVQWRGWAPGTEGIHVGFVGPRGLGTEHAGEYICTDVGYTEVADGISASGAVATRLESIFRTDEDGQVTGEYITTLIRVLAGDGSTPGSSKIHRQDSNGDWVEIEYLANTAYTGAAAAKANEDGTTGSKSMTHTAVFPAGSSLHDPGSSGASGANLGLPIVVFTSPADPVYVYPADLSGQTHSEKYTELYAGSLEPFYATGCISWEGRMFYGGTQEDTSGSFPRRIRWSGLFEASPDPARPGAGFVDVVTLKGRFLRFEILDPFLVAYFEDGILLIERTGLQAQPHRFRVLTSKRGLLGSHSVCSTGSRSHFILATDGFHEFSGNGEFRELGLFVAGNDRDNTDSTVLRKWHRTFFQQLDQENAHRIQCHYDQLQKSIRIAWPSRVTGDMEIWTYDYTSDRMFPGTWGDVIGAAPTCFADHNGLIRAALAWDDVGAPEFWDDSLEDLAAAGSPLTSLSWASGAAQFGRSSMYHGSDAGRVFRHDVNTDTFAGTPQRWQIMFKKLETGDSRRAMLFEKLWVEFGDIYNDSETASVVLASLRAFPLRGFATPTALTNLNQSFGGGDMAPVADHLDARITGGYCDLSLFGIGPVVIRKLFLDFLAYASEARLRVK